MSQQLEQGPRERPTPLVGLPTPIDATQRAVYAAARPSPAMRPINPIVAAITPRRVIFGVGLAVLALLLLRGIEIRISEIIIHFGR